MSAELPDTSQPAVVLPSDFEAGQVPVAQTIAAVRELATPQGAEVYRQSLITELQEPGLRDVADRLGAAEQAYQEAVATTDTPEERARANQAREDKDAVRNQCIEAHGYENVRRYEKIREDLASSERGLELTIQDPRRSRQLVEGIITEATNGRSANRPHFIPGREVQDFVEAHQVGRSVVATMGVDSPPVDIPLTLFITAEEFVSWEEGRGVDTEGRPASRNKIEDFASRETPIPPVDDISLYVLPDGEVYAKANNAHRVAAAMRRGQETIPFNGAVGAKIYVLDAMPPWAAPSEMAA